MIFILIFGITLTAIAADLWHLFRLHRRGELRHRRGLIVWIAVTNLLPIGVSIIGLAARDNSTLLMSISMWLIWLWMLTVIPRLICYLFRWVGLPTVGIILASLLAALFVWGATIGRTSLHVSRVEVCSERLPAAFDGLRIVQLSDMHIGTLVSPTRELTRLTNKVNSLHPDVVIFTGDLINIRASELSAPIRSLLQRIEAPVYSVTGNHDVGNYVKDTLTLPPAETLRELIRRQQAMSWTVLQDTTTYLHRGADSISLTGLSFDPALRDRRHDRDLPAGGLDAAYRNVPQEVYNITAVHLPQLWNAVTTKGYGDLTLSGHVHAMQFKIRPWGRGWSPAMWLYTQWSGRYNAQGRTLYINDGTGYVAYPMRLGAWPEITLITLKRCK